jgi:hypothetical protein
MLGIKENIERWDTKCWKHHSSFSTFCHLVNQGNVRTLTSIWPIPLVPPRPLISPRYTNGGKYRVSNKSLYVAFRVDPKMFGRNTLLCAVLVSPDTAKCVIVSNNWQKQKNNVLFCKIGRFVMLKWQSQKPWAIVVVSNVHWAVLRRIRHFRRRTFIHYEEIKNCPHLVCHNTGWSKFLIGAKDASWNASFGTNAVFVVTGVPEIWPRKTMSGLLEHPVLILY